MSKSIGHIWKVESQAHWKDIKRHTNVLDFSKKHNLGTFKNSQKSMKIGPAAPWPSYLCSRRRTEAPQLHNRLYKQQIVSSHERHESKLRVVPWQTPRRTGRMSRKCLWFDTSHLWHLGSFWKAHYSTLVASQRTNTMQVISGAARLGQNEGTNAARNQNES